MALPLLCARHWGPAWRGIPWTGVSRSQGMAPETEQAPGDRPVWTSRAMPERFN